MKISVVFCLIAAAQAFTSTAPSSSNYLVSQTQSHLNLMTQNENDAVMNTATDCVQSECSLEEIDGLISLLKDQQKEAYQRLEDVKGMIKSLETGNSSSDRSTDEIRETVRAIFRIFQLGDKASGNDYPALSKPTGWSGEVGKGPTTAYDALPPKPFNSKKSTH